MPPAVEADVLAFNMVNGGRWGNGVLGRGNWTGWMDWYVAEWHRGHGTAATYLTGRTRLWCRRVFKSCPLFSSLTPRLTNATRQVGVT